MIPFDPSKIQYDYVYISKISKFSIVVNMDDNGEQYLPAGVKYKVKGAQTVIPIHNRVFKLYEQHNFTFEFANKGRRACIFYYDGYVLIVDIYKPYTFIGNTSIKETEWESLNIGAMNKVVSLIQSEEDTGINRDIFIDGETIYFTSEKPTEFFGKDNAFWLQKVRFIRLSKMAVGMSKAMKQYFDEKKNDEESSNINNKGDSEQLENKKDGESKEKNSVIVLKEGYVLGYNPFVGEDDDFAVFSPVVANDKFINQLFSLEIKDIHHFNLNFALRAGNIIGKHYGFEETDFLDFPSIIVETGIINLKSDVSYQSKVNYPLDIPNEEVLAYLMRFAHKETDLNVYRDLVSLFTLALSMNGVVKHDKLSDVFVEGKSLSDIPTRNVDIANIANIGTENFDGDELSFDRFKRQEDILDAKLFRRRMKKKKAGGFGQVDV